MSHDFETSPMIDEYGGELTISGQHPDDRPKGVFLFITVMPGTTSMSEVGGVFLSLQQCDDVIAELQRLRKEMWPR